LEEIFNTRAAYRRDAEGDDAISRHDRNSGNDRDYVRNYTTDDDDGAQPQAQRGYPDPMARATAGLLPGGHTIISSGGSSSVWLVSNLYLRLSCALRWINAPPKLCFIAAAKNNGSRSMRKPTKPWPAPKVRARSPAQGGGTFHIEVRRARGKPMPMSSGASPPTARKRVKCWRRSAPHRCMSPAIASAPNAARHSRKRKTDAGNAAGTTRQHQEGAGGSAQAARNQSGRQGGENKRRTAMIRKLASGKYRLYSRKKNPRTGKRRNLGTFSTKKAAQQHERDIQYFKRH
jgi:hypothetical protein